VNRRPTLFAAIALTATAALTLSACGSDDSSKDKDNDKIAGADTGSETSSSPSPSASVSADRPKIELPADLSYTFDWPKTGDADKDAVLADGEQSIKAVDQAIVNQNALDKAYIYYYEGEAAVGVENFVKEYVDAKVGITGAYRFYNPEVAVDKDGTASLSYCEDQGKAYAKDLKTGKARKTKVTSDSYVIYHTSLKKNGKGVWTIQKIVSQRGSAKCQP
jgi:transglutaminase/protease-like cytokinesis protein 3